MTTETNEFKRGFHIAKSTVEKIKEMVLAHHKATNGGLPASKVAKDLCGDEKYTVMIQFTVDHDLVGVIESKQGVGLIPHGVEATRTNVRHMDPPDQAFLDSVELVLASLIKANNGKPVTNKALEFTCVMKGLTKLEEPAKFRGGVVGLTEGEGARYELKNGKIGMRKVLIANPLTAKVA